jgi:predicted GTPase
VIFFKKKREPKVYLLLGITGTGKSTVGNCLYNKSGKLELIAERPFKTSSDASACTKKFQCEENGESDIIIDTIGFADNQHEVVQCLRDILKALEHPKVNSKVDCVLFLVRAGRFSKEIIEFFNKVQVEVLKNKCLENSMLVVTDCRVSNWVSKQMNNEFVNKALVNCNQLYYEFNLKFDDENDDDDDKRKNTDRRQKAINALVEKIEDQSFQKVDLKFLETAVEEEKKRKNELEKMKTTISNQPTGVPSSNKFFISFVHMICF